MSFRDGYSEVDEIRRPFLSLRFRVEDVLILWHSKSRRSEQDGREGFLPDASFDVQRGRGEVEMRGEDVDAEVEAMLDPCGFDAREGDVSLRGKRERRTRDGREREGRETNAE